MPNPFSKLKIRNIIYDVKDAIARSSIGNLSELQTEHKDNLVDAINDAAQSGGGGSTPYTQNPSSLGQANPGSVNQYARGDHVHPMPSASDVGALPDSTTIPTKTSQLQNDSGFLTSAPVSSVNGYTGAVSLSIPSSAADVGAVAVAQGVAHAGEFVVVGSDGNITTVALATWQGGSY